MSANRIQKLLFSEYCDFEDMVLVESPFAETNRAGEGLRQVHLGLTPSKLVLATDIVPMVEDSPILFISGLDPEIETMELIAVYPIDCVNLSVFHKKKRQALKARFCNNNVMYFELGGFEKRSMFWNLWCEKIKFLAPNEAIFSQSETSIATSTSNSTLYLISSKQYTCGSNKSQIWCQYAAGDFARHAGLQAQPSWPDKHLYMGELDESPMRYMPVQKPPSEEDFIKPRSFLSCLSPQPCGNDAKKIQRNASPSCHQLQFVVNRFSANVADNCRTGLYLPVEKYREQSKDTSVCHLPLQVTAASMLEIANSALRLWEMQTSRSSLVCKQRHRRRYAFQPRAHFLRGLGPWDVHQGERFTLQMKRAVSMVSIRRQPQEKELRLPVSRRHLLSSLSFDNFDNIEAQSELSDHRQNRHNSLGAFRHLGGRESQVIAFWTPEYWYRPAGVKQVYRELRQHINQICQHRQRNQGPQTSLNYSTRCSFASADQHNTALSAIAESDEKMETSLACLKRVLRMQIALSAWDFTSDILANQLTLIDRDLFVRIAPEELPILLWQQSSKNASNIRALIAFSHRISSLVATEILKDRSERIRARLITRFINVADKCHAINNFQSCRSILAGLQSPPIFRLRATWNYVRRRHSSRYEAFEKLCRQHRDTNRCAHFIPHSMPFIGDIISHLLSITQTTSSLPSISLPSLAGTATSPLGLSCGIKALSAPPAESRSVLRRIVSSLKAWHTNEVRHCSKSQGNSRHHIPPEPDYRAVASKCKQMYFFESKRQEILKEYIRILQVHQSAAYDYNFPVHQLCREYLLKARYKEDQENFLYSLNHEPMESSSSN